MSTLHDYLLGCRKRLRRRFVARTSAVLALIAVEAKLRLERFHLMTDGTLCDAQLFGRARKALVPGGGLKCLERVQGRQLARHHKRPIV